MEAVRQGSLSRFVGKHEREKRDKIERENQILLRKILDCHHGVDRDRTSVIPSPAEGQERLRSREERLLPAAPALGLLRCGERDPSRGGRDDVDEDGEGEAIAELPFL